VIIKSRYFFPAYFFAALILIFSSLPPEGIEKARDFHKLLGLLLSDYSLHLFAFGLLTALLSYGFFKTKNFSLPYLRIGLLSFGFGLFIELYQIFLPHRSFSLEDLASDLVGIIIFLFLIKIFLAAFTFIQLL